MAAPMFSVTGIVLKCYRFLRVSNSKGRCVDAKMAVTKNQPHLPRFESPVLNPT